MEEEIGEISLDRARVLIAKFYAARSVDGAEILLKKIKVVTDGLVGTGKGLAANDFGSMLSNLYGTVAIAENEPSFKELSELSQAKLRLVSEVFLNKEPELPSQPSQNLLTTTLGCAAAITAVGLVTKLVTKSTTKPQPAQVAA